MQYGTLAATRDGQSISGATGKDAEPRSSGGGNKTQGRKKEMTIPNNPKCLSRPLGTECGNTAKGKSSGVGVKRRQQLDHGRRGGRGQ